MFLVSYNNIIINSVSLADLALGSDYLSVVFHQIIAGDFWKKNFYLKVSTITSWLINFIPELLLLSKIKLEGLSAVWRLKFSHLQCFTNQVSFYYYL